MSIGIHDNDFPAISLAINQDRAALVSLPTDPAKAGYTFLADPDSSERYNEFSKDYRLRVGSDSRLMLWDANGTTQNVNQWLFANTTHTAAQANGFLTLNSGSSTAVGNYNVVSSRTFEHAETFPLYGEFRLKLENQGITNSLIEFGFGFISGTTAPTDGVFVRISNNACRLVISDAGTETTSADIPLSTDVFGSQNSCYGVTIEIASDLAILWVNGNKVASLQPAAGTQGCMRVQNVPVFLRNLQSGVTAQAVRIHIAEIEVSSGDQLLSIPTQVLQSMLGGGSYQGQDTSATLGSTSNLTNSGAYASGTLTNTAAPSAGYTGTTLGGRFQFAALAAAATDFILFAYQNPAGSAAVNGRQLVITGITIDSVNTGAAVATTPTTLFFALGVGATAVSLATADATVPTTKAPRRIPLGFQSYEVGAGIGRQAERLEVQFHSPVVVDHGQFVHLIMTVTAGTATASQVIMGSVRFNGFFV